MELVDNKPKWNNRCTQCMACIGGCPLNAIEYKKMTQNKVRYYLKEHYRKV
ncbi:MAG: 4Fe-4S binding protein [Thomasclavelia spiroformis]